MSRLVKKLMVVLLAAFIFMGVVTTPVQAKGSGGRGHRSGGSEDETTVEPVAEVSEETEETAEEATEEAEETVEEATEEAAAEESAQLEEATEAVLLEEEAIAEDAITEEASAEEGAVEESVDIVEIPAISLMATKAETNAVGTKAVSGAPANSKQLIPNGDGTYTLALSVTGASESSSTTQVTKANVILVIDTSDSMYKNYTTYNGQRMRRLVAEKHVLADDGGIVDSLLAQNVAGDPLKSDIIEIALANFDTRGSTAQSFTTNATTLKNTINGLDHNSGTNWEEGLMRAQELATSIKTSQPNEEVYIIFLTDGEPTTHNNSYNVNTNYATEWGYANDNARALVTAGHHFYGIFTWGSGNSSHYLSSLVQYAYTGSGDSSSNLDSAYAQYFTDATSTEALIAALNQITHDITNSVGYTNVEIEDGVTTMTSSSIKVNAGGTVTGAKYYRSGGDYGEANFSEHNYGTEWSGAPTATINEDGEVDWNLGNTVLENGVTYTITFTVWPSQDSLDMVADLNNGILDYDKDLTEAQKAQIIVSGGTYTLKTNTDFPTVTYSTVTTTTVDGQSTQVVSEPQTVNMINPNPVGLSGSEMVARKIWAVDLQTSRLREVLYEKDGTPKKVQVPLDVYKDNVKIDTITLGWVDVLDDPETEDVDESAEYEYDGYYDWADASETIWQEKFAVAPGVMTTSEDLKDNAKKTIEFNGKTYYILETGHDYELKEPTFDDYHFDLITKVYHPMLVDGELRDVVFTYSGDEIVGIETIGDEILSSIDAINTLRGGINLKKVVLDPTGTEYPVEDEFEFTITLENENDVFKGESIPWYSVNGKYYHNDEGEYISEDEAKELYGDEAASHGNVLTGSEKSVSATLSITTQDTVRIANVPVGTKYTITEASNNKYVLDAIEHVIQLNDGTESEQSEADVDTDARKIVSDIVPNRENNVTFKNKMNEYPAFYVYHSSDKTIEKIFVNDERVSRSVDETTGLSSYTFNIVNETKSDHLYGGYFSAYKGAGMTDSAIIAATYSNSDSKSYTYDADKTNTTTNWFTDSNGSAYDGKKASQWNKKNAYTEANGLAMNPVANKVYYLKEVPDQFFRPALYYVYDNRAENKPLKKLYLMVPTDDNLYQLVCGRPIEIELSKKLYSSFKVENANGTSTTIKVNNINSNLTRGYLTVWDAAKFMIAGEVYEWTPNFVTLDGVEVTSCVTRTISMGDLCYGDKETNFDVQDEKLTSAAAVYEAE